MRKLFRLFKANKNQIESKNETSVSQENWYCYPETNSIIEVFEEKNIKYEIIKDNDESIIYKFDFIGFISCIAMFFGSTEISMIAIVVKVLVRQCNLKYYNQLSQQY